MLGLKCFKVAGYCIEIRLLSFMFSLKQNKNDVVLIIVTLKMKKKKEKRKKRKGCHGG